MFDIAILGAGDLGGELAHQVARRDLARTVRLIDDPASVAAGKALDITQAAPVEGFHTRLVSSAEPGDAAAAAMVVVADRAAGGEWTGEDALALLKRICA